jgi:hypothetical protein
VYRITATSAVARGQFRVTPSLVPYLKVSPTTVTNLQKGQSVSVSVTLSLPIDVNPATIAGTLQLREVSALGTLGNNIAKPLPVTIVVQCPCLPPKPDPVLNNATIAGIDINVNGVRDDVERTLYGAFAGTSDLEYAMEYARQTEAHLRNPPPATREEALQAVSLEYCSTIGASEKVRAFPMSRAVINTQVRQEALNAFNDVLGLYDSLELVGVASCLK